MLNTMNMADSYKKSVHISLLTWIDLSFHVIFEVKDQRDPLFVLESNFLPKKIQDIFQTSTASTDDTKKQKKICTLKNIYHI